MKRAAFALLSVLAPALVNAEVLETPSYVVSIEVRCPEGSVTCDDVIYTGKSKKSGKTIVLKGSTWHTICADGMTPCRFIGYKFKAGKTAYSVTEDGDLTVTRGNKVLIEEHGQWR